MKKYHITARHTRDAQRIKIPDRETLISLYVDSKLSIEDTGKQIGLSALTVAKLLKEQGIRIRDKTELSAEKHRGQKLSKKQRKFLSNMAKKRIGPLAPRWGKKLSEETKQKISNSLKGRFRKHLNPQWKENAINRWRVILHNQFEYKEWRKQVFERDHYACATCRKPSNGDIRAHHIVPVETDKDKIFDVNNGITLCKKCHRSIKKKELRFIDLFHELVVHPLPSL